MKTLNRILTVFLFVLLTASCNQTSTKQDFYPKNISITNPNGQPKDSLALYFPFSINCNCDTTIIEADSFLLKWYSSSLYNFKEPILYNFYLGHDIYRFLWLRSFHRPVVFILNKHNNAVSLTIKELDRHPDFCKIVYDMPDGKDSVKPFNRKANIVVNETKELSLNEWNKFESLLEQCNFWTMKPVERELGCDGAEWIIEAHLQDKYWFVVRWSPKKDYFSECGKYLIELSGNKYEIY